MVHRRNTAMRNTGAATIMQELQDKAVLRAGSTEAVRQVTEAADTMAAIAVAAERTIQVAAWAEALTALAEVAEATQAAATDNLSTENILRTESPKGSVFFQNKVD